MKYKLANGQFIGAGQAFTWNEIQYPSNWIDLSTQEDRDAIGIIEIQEQQRPDDRYYFVTDNGDGSYSTTAKDLNDGDEYVDLRGVTRRVLDLKSQWIAQVKDTAGKLLAQTDWMIIRKMERNVDVSADVVAKRLAILAEVDRLETAINACADVESLIAVVGSQNWGQND